jgi:5-formyltetrahydrofolate cyclo-ligase
MGDRQRASRIITDKIVRANFFQRARTIGCYLPTEVEVDTGPIFLRAWRMKKRIFAPVITKNDGMQFREVSVNSDLLDNEFGIPEPVAGDFVPARKLDIVVTPLVAFDDMRNRIGMGGGYFDRTFSFLGRRECFVRPKLIGVAFNFQKVEKITANPWDIRVFCTITESS